MKQKIAIFFISCFSLVACSNHNDIGTEQRKSAEHWQNFSESKENLNYQLNDNQSLLVVYREDKGVAPAVDIYVNKDYQASLLKGGVTQIMLCQPENLLSVSYTSSSSFGNRTKGTVFSNSGKTIYYVKIDTANQMQPTYQFVDAHQASKAIQLLKYQTHSLSRAEDKQHCS